MAFFDGAALVFAGGLPASLPGALVVAGGLPASFPGALVVDDAALLAALSRCSITLVASASRSTTK